MKILGRRVKLLNLVLLAMTTMLTNQMMAENKLKVQIGQLGHKPWDPMASAMARYTFNSAVFTKAFEFSRQYEIFPGYIQDWKWDYKKNSYELKLADLTFQNGRKVTSKDVEFTILRPYLTKLDRPERVLFKNIEGIEAVKQGEKYRAGMISGIKTPDERTIILKLVKPNPLFLYSFSESLPPLAPAEELEDDLYTFKKMPVGTGNYKVSEITKEGNVVVKRVLNPRSGAPDIIEFYNSKTALENDVDIAVNAGANGIEESNKAYSQVTGEGTTAVQVLDFNYKHPLSRIKEFREILDVGIERPKAFSGQYKKDFKVTFQMVPKEFYGSFPRVDPFNRKLAQDLFSKLPKELAKETLVFYYHGANGSLPPYLASIKSDLENLGFKTDFIRADRPDFENQHKHAVGYIYGRTTNFADPLLVYNFYLPDSPVKHNFPTNDCKFMELYQKALEADTVESRAPIIRSISKHFADNVLNVPLAEVKNFYAYKANKIKSIGIDKIFLTLNFDLIEFESNSK